MRLSIFKYTVPIQDEFGLLLPGMGKILSFQVQADVPVIWALVNPQAAPWERRFRIFGTGHPVSADIPLAFIGTIQLDTLVWHLFEELS